MTLTIETPTEEQLSSFRVFAAEKKIVIADTNKTIRAAIAQALVDLGAKSSNMLLASGLSDGAEAITALGADFVFADYNLGDRCGLELVTVHRETRPDIENLVFILVTGNAQESAVAEAAEEDVDSYILKPFTNESLKNYIVAVGLSKICPSPYRTKISKGKELLLASKPDEAITEFRAAKQITEAPSLACYYEGQAFELKNDSDVSEICYEEGLMHNPIHYKCSVALFDLWTKKGKNIEAYDLICKVLDHFPLNPQRLCKTIDLAVRTGHFDDVSRYYQVFTGIQERREDLKKYVSAALVVGAVFQFRKGENTLGIDLMNKAAITAAGNIATLRDIILTLADFGQGQAADGVLRRFPADQKGTHEFHVAEYAVIDRTHDIGQVIAKGRALIKADVHEIPIYRILIRRTAEAGHHDTAESLAQDGSRHWPKERDSFLALARSQVTDRVRG